MIIYKTLRSAVDQTPEFQTDPLAAPNIAAAKRRRDQDAGAKADWVIGWRQTTPGRHADLDREQRSGWRRRRCIGPIRCRSSSRQIAIRPMAFRWSGKTPNLVSTTE
jgi:hypothetical protein